MIAVKDLLWAHSWQVQKNDAFFLKPPLCGSAVLHGYCPRPTWDSSIVEPYPGSMQSLLKKISATIHATIDNCDYNGLCPLMSLNSQLKMGNSFRDISIDATEKYASTTCVGMSYAIIEALKVKHSVDGYFAAMRIDKKGAFCHAAVIIECKDGYVLADPRPAPWKRIFAYPFNARYSAKAGGVSTSDRGSLTPMTLRSSSEAGTTSSTYCLKIANAADLVMKYFMMEVFFRGAHIGSYPICCYDKKNGKLAKGIFVSLKDKSVVLKNTYLLENDDRRTVQLNFSEVRQGLLSQHLRNLCREPKGSLSFRLPIDQLNQQIAAIVDDEERITRSFVNLNDRSLAIDND